MCDGHVSVKDFSLFYFQNQHVCCGCFVLFRFFNLSNLYNERRAFDVINDDDAFAY